MNVQRQRYPNLEDEVAACGGVTAYVLHPHVPGWAHAYITVTANGAACMFCKVQPCPEPTTIISLQAAEGATLMLPMPVCAGCCNPKQVLAALDCVCVDLFAQPVRLQVMTYGG